MILVVVFELPWNTIFSLFGVSPQNREFDVIHENAGAKFSQNALRPYGVITSGRLYRTETGLRSIEYAQFSAHFKR